MEKMNQNDRNEFKGEITEFVKGLVDGATEFELVDTVKGFVIVTEKAYVEVSCVVKKETFDIIDAQDELAEKIQNAIDREKERADKKAKALAKKEKAKAKA